MEEGKVINAIVVEDEPIAVEVLQQYFKQTTGIRLIRAFNTANAALFWLSENHADVIFLDINLPGLSGIEFANALTHRPAIIFTTAYSEYALDGFNLNAVDYLLKPFSYQRFLQAIQKLKLSFQKLHSANSNQTLLLKSNKKLYPIHPSDIAWVEANGDYINVVLKSEKLIVNMPLKEILDKLPEHFLQVHRSFIINTQLISFVENSRVNVGGKDIPLGDAYKNGLQQMLDAKHE